jgi:hypothetical protein
MGGEKDGKADKGGAMPLRPTVYGSYITIVGLGEATDSGLNIAEALKRWKAPEGAESQGLWPQLSRYHRSEAAGKSGDACFMNSCIFLCKDAMPCVLIARACPCWSRTPAQSSPSAQLVPHESLPPNPPLGPILLPPSSIPNLLSTPSRTHFAPQARKAEIQEKKLHVPLVDRSVGNSSQSTTLVQSTMTSCLQQTRVSRLAYITLECHPVVVCAVVCISILNIYLYFSLSLPLSSSFSSSFSVSPSLSLNMF